MLEGFLHASIEGGTILRIDQTRLYGNCIEHHLQLLGGEGWMNVHTITTRMLKDHHTSSIADIVGANADLRAYAAFLYQGRLRKPLSASELGHPEADLHSFPPGIRSYEQSAAVA